MAVANNINIREGDFMWNDLSSYNKVAVVVTLVGGVIAFVFLVIGMCDIKKNTEIWYKRACIIISFIGIACFSSGGIFIIYKIVNFVSFDVKTPLFDNQPVIEDNLNNSDSNYPNNMQESQEAVINVDTDSYPSDEITEWVVDKRNDVLYYYQAFLVGMSVRNVTKDDKEFHNYVYADVGDVVEYQVEYLNSSSSTMENVVMKSWLPNNGEYVEATTKLYNSSFPEGAINDDDTIAVDGINVGSYTVGSNAYLRYRMKVKDTSLVMGTNRLVTWIGVQSGTGGMMLKSADVYVEKK